MWLLIFFLNILNVTTWIVLHRKPKAYIMGVSVENVNSVLISPASNNNDQHCSQTLVCPWFGQGLYHHLGLEKNNTGNDEEICS